MSDTNMVPHSRLNEEIAKRKEIEADLNALKATLATVEAKAAEADSLRAQLASATAEHETFRVGVEAGITDPEGLDLARYFYDKVQAPDGGERPSFADYMSKLKSEPTARPKALGAYFTDATAPAAPAAASAPQAAPGKPGAPQAAAPATPAPAAPIAPQRTAAPLPGLHTGATPAPSPAPAAGGWTAAQLASMSPGEYATHRAELLQQAGAGFTGLIGRR
jgi:hypothetical protein